MRRIFVFLIAGLLIDSFYASSFYLFGQELAVDEAKRRAANFSLDAEFEFPEYKMVADVTAEASPDSEYLFRARANMEILQTNEFRVEKLQNVPNLIADNRLINRKRSEGGVIYAGPFTRYENSEWLFIDGKPYDLRGKIMDYGSADGRRHPLDISEPAEILDIEMAIIQPFDWPLFTSVAFERRSKDRDMFRYTFGKDRLCSFATRERGLLESLWIKPSNKVAGVRKITFDEDRIVSHQLFVYSRPVDIEKIDLKSGWPIIESQIIWEKKGTGAYPKTVVSTMRPEFQKPDAVLVIANIKLYCPGDPAFDSRRTQVQKQIAKATAPKNAK